MDLALRTPHPARAQPGVRASAERRQLTVMFCDLAGSTELASRLDPEDLREVVGAVLRRLTEVVMAFNGFVADYMGDGALVYFGYPEAHENDAECAIRAALQAAEEVSALSLLNGYRPHVRIGIATGLVVVGATGGTGIDAIRNAAGATPNLAARLQALAEPGAVVVAPSTHALAGRLFEYRDLGPVSLKGFSEPVRAWQVIGTAPAESRFEAQHDTSLAPLVGREEEMAVLSDLWRQTTRQGKGRVVMLSGEPGVGKSRLTAMLMERLTGEAHIRLRYFCSPHLQGSPLHPCIQQLERAAGFTRGDSPARKLERLEAALLRSINSIEDIALFADLLSLPTGERYPKLHFSPQKRKEKTMEALVKQLDLLSRQQPVLMIFEDAHWSDPTTRDLLPLAVDLIAQRPIMLIVTFRPEFQAAWSSRKHVSAIVLRPLPREESAVLVEQIAGAGRLPREVLEDIVDRSDGVPLYIEELTKAVLEASAQDERLQDM
ncbi:MAG TPA: AAA family ATPase, partial [Burkholderiales bacterium]|nr:AAA family ATPase [Burkholderiales bacterium]